MTWNYDVENVPEGDARKLVTLEKDEMVWIGIRAFRHDTKKWVNNGAEGDERVVAWQDLPEPANPRYFAMPKEVVEEFERIMQEEVIPEIEKDIQERAKLATEARKTFIFD